MTKRLKIRVLDHAEQDILEAYQWWQKNRPDAPDLLRREIDRAFKLLRFQPRLGVPARHTALRGIRRIYLSRVRYYLYYRIRSSAVEVLALWHASRGSGPLP